MLITKYAHSTTKLWMCGGSMEEGVGLAGTKCNDISKKKIFT